MGIGMDFMQRWRMNVGLSIFFDEQDNTGVESEGFHPDSDLISKIVDRMFEY
jgi:hypothetical protein